MTYWNVPVEPVPAIGSGALQVKRLHPHARLPTRATEHSAGLDFYALCDVVIPPGRAEVIETGFAVAIPEGCAGFLWPRSGLAAKASLDRLAGLIDADYRGEVRAVLINHGKVDIRISARDKVIQMVIQPITMLEPVEVDQLPDTERGDGGFGSTGK